ncbi:uncharacterized protein [Panulirus ornatus]|uniref:uncharacterized protein n=1 Tax=Panulirus ornatus TaxID=150431 RepID=UPI003A876569
MSGRSSINESLIICIFHIFLHVCAKQTQDALFVTPAAESQRNTEAASVPTRKIVLFDRDQIFIPTIPSVDNPEAQTGLGRYDLDFHSVVEYSPGILTIGTESPWKNEGLDYHNKSSHEAPYGTWRSPITSDVVMKPTNIIVEPPKVDAISGYVFWCEQLSGGKDGQNAVFHFNPDSRETCRWTPKEYDVRSRVHEYGGGAFTVYNNTLFFSHGDDGAIYRQNGPSAKPTRLTKTQHRRYADGVFSPQWNALFYVVEDHKKLMDGDALEPVNGIVMVDASTGDENVVVSHADFFASPRVSQDGTRLVWLQWNHPQMPWDGTQMFVGEIQAKRGEIALTRFFQHGSMMMPSFDQNNELFYVHDSTGWWNLYMVTRRGFEINLTPEPQEVGWPMWKLGRQAYDVNPRIGSNEAVVICGHDLIVVDLLREKRRVISTGYSSYSLGITYSSDGEKVYVVAGDGVRSNRLVEVDVRTGETYDVSGASDAQIDVGYISTARLIQFPTTQGDFAYGYLYMPKNKDYHAPVGSKPPLLVKAHEGPTSAASTLLNLSYQFFTSRGFAILDVDYRGSTGYGKLYRNKLNEMWGVYDVEDVLAGASHLVQEELVDKNQLCIDGSSIGAFTTLSALTIAGTVFKAGASYYGVSDPEMLATDTHKFKKNYMDTLIGNLDKHRDRYVTRSPLKNYERLEVPTIFFHGTEDKVVPPSQAKGMYELVKSKGLPTALILFEGMKTKYKM